MKGAATGAASALIALATKPFPTSLHQTTGLRVQLMQLISLPLLYKALGKRGVIRGYGYGRATCERYAF